MQCQVGVQDDGFPILSVDKPGWWWVVHTCNDIYKLEPPVKEDTVTGRYGDRLVGFLTQKDLRTWHFFKHLVVLKILPPKKAVSSFHFHFSIFFFPFLPQNKTPRINLLYIYIYILYIYILYQIGESSFNFISKHRGNGEILEQKGNLPPIPCLPLSQVKELMKSIGFGYPGGPDRAANLELPVTSYSGGWKMKMQLCAWDGWFLSRWILEERCT